ncbi:MAG: type II secretion system minor pseudopilin GspK [Pseudomonas sp.]|uniref:Type II secretion system protein K n=1 Tax=Stutzerimonas frequens TaxID=2968969 RepID=A0ABX6XXU5_9GAMM|nr:type II secretion system minor pseudopilin GspK [Stutzerimonas frequens]MBA4725504.1 type II secretion system minor pseudopilin GspK [Pseudomonas sp.]WCR46012.1 type II secretion system minor pseudopilin GspK [Stutzerimonas stutzeri]MBK3918889.1 general secretion pathway protein GspK [Stutzerimonas frequens]MCQ4304881.1 type II secretion system minor pseudopilin GspK [Stutzerimonas frequens]PNF52391.1 general secretion pathway protein GspK [Stutzerimonas frequens]|tara:strand:- start:539 stop:1507 length:969 start_codon:yes stop_codon:yes gene_type:complete
MSRQRGVALITVLLVVAIVTVVSGAMVARQQLSIRATSNQLQARQAWHYALGGEALAQAILARDLKGGEPGAAAIDHLLEPWAQPLPAFEIDQGEILVRIEDLAGRFNLNDLLRDQQPNPAAVEQFRRLLLRLQISAPYAERLLDWIDPDQQPSGELGAEDNAYLGLDTPYRSAGRRLHDLSELRLLLDMREEDFQRLAPYVVALPPNVPLNVNTASAMVLSSLSDNLSLGAAESLVELRRAVPFRNSAAFLAQPALAGTTLQGTALAVGSQFFQATSEVRLGDRRLALVSLLQREQDGSVRVLARNLGQPARQTLPSDGER